VFYTLTYATLYSDFSDRNINWQLTMPGPSFTFAFIFATIIGAFFHLIVGGRARRLSTFILFAWFGFAFGQCIANLFEIVIFPIGEIHIIPATFVTVVILIFAHFLTKDRTPTQRSR